MIKTIVPQQRGLYNSFPTFVQERSRIFLFYRRGAKGRRGSHGSQGQVRCLVFEREEFLEAFREEKTESLYPLGQDGRVFGQGNEMDAIVSDLGGGVFSLATRSYDNQGRMTTFISVADHPHFADRIPVTVEGVRWLVFYGKSFRWNRGFVFSAYGWLKNENFDRPLLLFTEEGEKWELLSYLPSGDEGLLFNEGSVVFHRNRYFIFLRHDRKPFGLWYSTSRDLQQWAPAQMLFESAHAPMAFVAGERLWLSYRRLLGDNRASTALIEPFAGRSVKNLEVYPGNWYDGGYSDLGHIGEDLFVVYYQGNEVGEPSIKCWSESPATRKSTAVNPPGAGKREEK
ncbi:MAG: hypothetical protein ACE5JX_10020 [Acidobacteriota bacterium]